MNFMTRSGLNQQMQGEYRVLLLALSHPILSGSWQRIFYGLKFMIRDFFLVRKFWLVFCLVRMILQGIFGVFKKFGKIFGIKLMKKNPQLLAK